MNATNVFVKPNPLFYQMLQSALKSGQASRGLIDNFHHVALDPGETTGVAISRTQSDSIQLIQVSTPDVETGMDALEQVLGEFAKWPTLITIEDYKVYGWKSDSHKWASLHTPMLIGALRWWVYQRRQMYIHLRMAQQAKGFATDVNLKRWGLYEPGMKHARDAERHLLTTLFFSAEVKSFQVT